MRALLLSLSLLVLPSAALAQAREEVVQLESTVGLDPSSCASQSHLALPAAGEVVVCLTLTNNGVDTLYLHQIVSDRLGVLEEAALYTLPVNQSVFYTYAVRVTQSSGLVSRWLSEDLLGRRYCQTDWSLVTVGRGAPGAHSEGNPVTCEEVPDVFVPPPPIETTTPAPARPGGGRAGR